MAFITTDTTTAFASDANTVTVFVKRGVLLSVASGQAIFLSGSNETAIIQGDVIGQTAGIQLGNSANNPSDPHGEKVTIFAGATVSGFGQDHGGVSVIGHNSTVQNAGDVWGNYYGIYLDTTSTISSQSAIGNSGSIIGGSYGLYVQGSEKVVTTNTGTIHGDTASFVDFSGNASQVVTNRGVMEGDILFAGGEDVYNGGKGSLVGAIFGLDGDDWIKTGADDDQIHGGKGLDRLAGGLGEDTFYFETTPNTATNADTITDFDPENDVLALDHVIFGLHVGKFTAASFLASKNGQAADAGDHFLYNTTSGNLYYDADGKGGAKADLLATFSHHPDITAADFIVV